MAAEPVLAGEIPDDGIVGLLAEIEACRTTGVLRFEADETQGEVLLVLGQISADQPERDDGEDAIDLLLDLRKGNYEVFQRLPPLPVSRGDDAKKEGSLEVHIPADLMNYCERAGLTGMLVLEHEDGTKHAEIIYDKGELTGIRLDGLDELNDVFGWEDGSFRVESMAKAVDFDAEIEELEELSEAPPPADAGAEKAEEEEEEEEDELDSAETLRPPPDAKPAPPDSTGKHFLKVVEVTLSEIIKEREERRPATRTSPPLPPMAVPKKHPTLRPPPAAPQAALPPKKRKERKDQTVRVVYLGGHRGKAKPGDSSTRHVRKDVTGETALPKATRKARKKKGPKAPTPTPGSGGASGEGGDEEEHESFRGSLAWAALTILVVLAALGLLAMLPPIE